KVVGPTSTGAPLALTGLGGHTIRVLAHAAGVPLGVEGAGPPLARPRVVAATGLRPRARLADIRAADPPYERRAGGGVIVFRPRDAWIQGNPILDLLVAGVTRANIQPVDAATIVQQLFSPSAAPAGLDDTKRFSVDLPPGRLIELLNGIVRAHGSMAW